MFFDAKQCDIKIFDLEGQSKKIIFVDLCYGARRHLLTLELESSCLSLCLISAHNDIAPVSPFHGLFRHVLRITVSLLERVLEMPEVY